MMHGLAKCVAFVVLSLLVVDVADTHAAPITVAYVDTVTGMEWAQVTDSVGFAWSEVAGACATDGTTACASNLGGVEFSGWTWAQVSQVLDLFSDATDLTRDQFAPDVYATNSTWAPQFFDIFNATQVTDTSRGVIGWAANGAAFDPRSAFAPEMLDQAAAGLDYAGRGALTDTAPPFAPPGTDYRGVWLFRPSQVPEPSTLLLVGAGALAAAWRSRRKTTAAA